MTSRIVIVGGGIFGVAAALELARRRHEVVVLEAGALPRPEAASTDISKIVRLEYGDDLVHTRLAERAREGWIAWNQAWRQDGRPALYNETGLLMLRREPAGPDEFERRSRELLASRGHTPETLDADALAERFPAWAGSGFAEATFHDKGGYAESAAVVWALAEDAQQLGVRILPHCSMHRLLVEAGRVRGVEDTTGERHEADRVVVAAGSWTPELFPELASSFTRVYQPVWHLRPRHPHHFRADRFPVFLGDIRRTGYYGFPLHPVHAVVKVGRHTAGIPEAEAGDLSVPEPVTAAMQAFLAESLPELADAAIVQHRLCPYCDTVDERFWIANDPDRPGLTVASGGSGHAFKFAPLLGPWIADTVEERPNDDLEAFRWRPDLSPRPDGASTPENGGEPTRCRR